VNKISQLVLSLLNCNLELIFLAKQGQNIAKKVIMGKETYMYSCSLIVLKSYVSWFMF